MRHLCYGIRSFDISRLGRLVFSWIFFNVGRHIYFTLLPLLFLRNMMVSFDHHNTINRVLTNFDVRYSSLRIHFNERLFYMIEVCIFPQTPIQNTLGHMAVRLVSLHLSKSKAW